MVALGMEKVWCIDLYQSSTSGHVHSSFDEKIGRMDEPERRAKEGEKMCMCRKRKLYKFFFLPRRFEYSYEIWINDENEYSKLLKIIFFDIWDVIRRPLVSWWYWLLEWRGKQELTFMQGCFLRNTVWTNVKGIGNWDWQTWKSFRETPQKKSFIFLTNYRAERVGVLHPCCRRLLQNWKKFIRYNSSDFFPPFTLSL